MFMSFSSFVIVVFVLVRDSVPVAGWIGYGHPCVDEDLFRDLFFDIEFFLFYYLFLCSAGYLHDDIYLHGLGDQDLVLGDLVKGLLYSHLCDIVLRHHGVISDISRDGDTASDGPLILLVDGDLHGHLHVMILGRERCATAGGIATAAVRLTSAGALLLIAATGALRLNSHDLVLHHSLVNGSPFLLHDSLRHVVSLLPQLRRPDQPGLSHIFSDGPHDLSRLLHHLQDLDDFSLFPCLWFHYRFPD